MKRLLYLDYLRGLAAVGIMLYHYLTWNYGHFTADTFFGKVGIYGVSIFYVLSGLTLYSVYSRRFEVRDFFLKRLFRIFPLLWVATIITFILNREFDFTKLALNLTGLFGLVDWSGHIAVGAWSIGNELVFYLIFPVLIYASRAGWIYITALSLLFFSVYCFFAFYVINPNLTIGQQGIHYMNPMNQAFLFVGGFLIGYFFKEKRVDQTTVIGLLIGSVLLFTLYPAAGETSTLIYGWNRIALTALCFLICFCFYKLEFILPNRINLPLQKLGEATYSIYLLHPIVYSCVLVAHKFIFSVPKEIKITEAAILTLFFSYLCYRYFEVKFMNVIKK